MTAQGLAVAPEIFPAATDASFLRVRGIPSLGFSPMRCARYGLCLLTIDVVFCALRMANVKACATPRHACARRRTPKLLHEHDEFLSVASFIEGIDIYEKLIPDLADFGAAHGRDAPSRDEL
jgi:aminoacylase